MSQDEPPIEDQPELASAGQAAAGLKRGAGVGRYVILEPIGQGGMGAVYAAFDPELDRRVALKLIRPEGLGSQQAENAQRRLLREAQALARLNHPNVVAVHDIGIENGQVFVAMAYIEGQDLKQWLATPGRSAVEVIALLLQAGDGLAAAHEAGLLHRDFKPANVLLGNDGRVQVADFGLARAMEPSADSEVLQRPASGIFAVDDPAVDDSDTTWFHGRSAAQTPGVFEDSLTVTGRTVGTPAFMAPEQFRGQSATAAADQFSFCLTLYISLFDQAPFETSMDWDPLHGDPRGMVRQPAKTAGVTARIERAILKGLATDPAERHESMTALLTELRRKPVPIVGWLVVLALVAVTLGFLSTQRAVQPCQNMTVHLEGVWGEEQKLGLRSIFGASTRPFAAAMGTRVEELLDDYAGGWVAMRTDACQATRVRREQSETLLDLRMSCLDRNLQELDSLITTLQQGDSQALDNSVAAAGRLRDLGACADTEALTAVQPLPRPELKEQVADLHRQATQVRTFNRLLQLSEAKAAAAELQQALANMDYPPVEAEGWLAIGQAQRINLDLEEAKPNLLRAAVEAEEGRVDGLRGQALLEYAALFYRRDSMQARPWLALSKGIVERLQDPFLRSSWLRSDAAFLEDEGHYEAAEQAAQEAVAISRRVYGTEHLETARSLFFLATMQLRLGRAEEALETFEACAVAQRRNFGDKHPELAQTLHLQAECLNRMSRNEEALALERQVLETWREVYGEKSSVVASALESLGTFHRRLGQFTQAQAALQRAHSIRQEIFDPKDVGLADSLSNLALLNWQQGKIDQAEDLFQQALAQMLLSRPTDHPLVDLLRLSLGRIRLDQGQPQQAVTFLEPLPQAYLSRVGPDHRWTINASLALAVAWLRLGRLADAEPLMAAVEEAVDAATLAPWLRGYFYVARAELAVARGEQEPASEWYRQARELYESQGKASAFRLGLLRSEYSANPGD